MYYLGPVCWPGVRVRLNNIQKSLQKARNQQIFLFQSAPKPATILSRQLNALKFPLRQLSANLNSFYGQ